VYVSFAVYVYVCVCVFDAIDVCVMRSI